MSQKILVLDDEKLIRWTLEQHLAKEGFEALTADSAVQGLVIINDENDRVTVADQLNGRIQVFQYLKTQESNSKP